VYGGNGVTILANVVLSHNIILAWWPVKDNCLYTIIFATAQNERLFDVVVTTGDFFW
jgi:hypothetical protein